MKCDYCEKPAEFVGGDIIYPHRPDLKAKRFYLCIPCDAYVGCHADGRPLGRLADKTLRQWKRWTHSEFDPLWQSGKMSRQDAYSTLSKMLKLPPEQTHIGMFDVDTCIRTIRLLATMKNKEVPNGKIRSV